MNNIDILELLAKKIEEQTSIIASCSSIINKKAEAKKRTEYIKIKKFVETLIAKNKELKEENEQLKNEEAEVRISASVYNRIMQLEEENARLKNKNSFDVYKMGQESQRSRIERDYIPKIKVREALKEEQERLKKGLGKFYNNDLGNSATRILQSLLGKE